MYAIVEISGKQYKVQADTRLYVPRLKAEPSTTLTFDQVLLVSNDGDVQVGAPLVKGASVVATVLAHLKGDKILVFKKKRRKRFRVKRGHRQPYTQIKIDAVNA
jgi:large subunit ribosomal protein L21